MSEVTDEDRYRIQTKYGILDRWCPTSGLMPLPVTMDLGIQEPRAAGNVTLHHIAAQESTVEQLQCGCEDRKTWRATRRCACFKANVCCSHSCLGGGKKDGADCPNTSALLTRLQKGRKDLVREGSTKK